MSENGALPRWYAPVKELIHQEIETVCKAFTSEIEHAKELTDLEFKDVRENLDGLGHKERENRKHINQLVSAPGRKARAAWQDVFRMVFRVLEAVGIAVVIYLLTTMRTP